MNFYPMNRLISQYMAESFEFWGPKSSSTWYFIGLSKLFQSSVTVSLWKAKGMSGIQNFNPIFYDEFVNYFLQH